MSRILARIFVLLCFAGIVTAALPAPAQTAAPDRQAVTRAAEAYLQNLGSMKAKFIQTGPDGTKIAGDFLLKRPGRMRFDYADPIKDFIVADGRFIYYYDSQMKETANAPISQSLADFFLRKDLRLSGDVRVTDVSRQGEFTVVSLVQAKDPGAGTLSLGFLTEPMQLKKWRITDAQGAITEVELFDAVTGIKLDNDLFHYYDPNRRTPGYN